MKQDQKEVSMGSAVLIYTLLSAIVLEQGYLYDTNYYKFLLFLIPLLLFAYYGFRKEMSNKKKAHGPDKL